MLTTRLYSHLPPPFRRQALATLLCCYLLQQISVRNQTLVNRLSWHSPPPLKHAPHGKVVSTIRQLLFCCPACASKSFLNSRFIPWPLTGSHDAYFIIYQHIIEYLRWNWFWASKEQETFKFWFCFLLRNRQRNFHNWRYFFPDFIHGWTNDSTSVFPFETASCDL